MMKVLRIVVLLLTVIGGAFAIRRLVGRNSETAFLDPIDEGAPLVSVPEAGPTL